MQIKFHTKSNGSMVDLHAKIAKLSFVIYGLITSAQKAGNLTM